ncbi:MAG TPA: NAD(P)H-hydrate dehydratase [Tepidisphaeraceae bacterium]|jgi:NAD(P)H-hydrate epimerase|nr:NAD(P)H-hydrate dehydratase [Tepidisphaeraceae bacterium]
MQTIADLPPLPPRPIDGHKGLFGRVLIVGGNKQMIGAPVMAGTSALRMGAGLVQVAMPRAVLAAGLSVSPELIGLALDKQSDRGRGKKNPLDSAAAAADAVVVGPGLGDSASAMSRLKRLVRMTKPMVVDADGLNMLAAQKKWPAYFKATAVLTPHPGEMKRLGKLIRRTEVPTDDAGRIDIATAAAKAFGQTVVLKGARTVVTDGKQLYLNTTGDSSLSKAGTGDVLSGIVGTLLAQKVEPFFAAAIATYLHGRAGELAGQRLGQRCVLAMDVIDALPEAIREYEMKHSG